MKLTKTIFSRIWWLGRGTATVMGLAVLLALTVGLASTALAGTGIGARFDLGKINKVNAVSSLVGSVSGPTLALENDRSDRAATALSLQMENPNLAPMRTNATGTVINLNADALDGRDSNSFADGTGGKANDASNADFATSAGEAQNAQVAANADRLDGKDSASFANGTNGKANDANLLDGKDSTDFVTSTFGTARNADFFDGKDSTSYFSGRTYTKDGPFDSGEPGNISTARVSCDQGDVALSGGHTYAVSGPHDSRYIFSERTSGGQYEVTFYDDDSFSGDVLKPNVTCADFPPLR